jgi:hypothetical protein
MTAISVFYQVRSRSLGAVIPEPLYIDPGLRENPIQLGIDADDKLPALKTLDSLLHNSSR